MKKHIIISIVLVLSIVGCSQKDIINFDKNSTLRVEERTGDELSSNYEVINKIEDEELIQEIIDIFQGIKWETNVDIEMTHEPDYKLNKNNHIWVTPKGNMLEIINRDNGYYVRLQEEASSELFEIMTGKEIE
ncbi:hypothetical protein J2R98_002859 [Alkalibacillus filiformis]|uniref:Lipoprotein n=1 Tax=Alkalibacillus filiformis TaxID=200990 RepID=A0ABU0DX23_9BACI|nr:hypothetical protein [Alkalibacillus filiformis]MDQ0352998.1 hypothetical protein [Alkalibacillus filiformis]